MNEVEARNWVRIFLEELETIEQHMKALRQELLRVAMLCEGVFAEGEKEDVGVDYTQDEEDEEDKEAGRWSYDSGIA